MPVVKEFAWFPVTVDRPDQGILHIVNGARYYEADQEVAVDDDYQARYFGIGSIAALSENEMRFTTDFDEHIIIRQTIPTDAARWDRGIGIDLPVDVIGAIMTNSTLPPTISAAVDAQGDVHTMVLESNVGLYARYARTWIRMGDISPIEALQIVDVPLDDLEVYDQADDVGHTVNIVDLHPVEAGYVTAVDVTPDVVPPVLAAAGNAQVIVASPADLPDAIEYAATDAGAGARWYVARRAKAFGWPNPLPWEDTP